MGTLFFEGNKCHPIRNASPPGPRHKGGRHHISSADHNSIETGKRRSRAWMRVHLHLPGAKFYHGLRSSAQGCPSGDMRNTRDDWSNYRVCCTVAIVDCGHISVVNSPHGVFPVSGYDVRTERDTQPRPPWKCAECYYVHYPDFGA